jgi:hypothetical protein
MKIYLILFFTLLSSSSLLAKEENRLKEKLWKACKEYIKETDSYKTFKVGKKQIRKINPFHIN